MTDASHDDPADDINSSVSGGARDVLQARDINGNIYFRYGEGSQGIAPRQLPVGVRVFVNRQADLARLDELLAASREADRSVVVYVISGTAGVGKTSLAVHWANRVRDQFPDGQLYVDLRGYDPGLPLTPDQVLEQFLLTLGVPAMSVPADLGTKSSIYRSVLAGKRVLIVLDNAATDEQVRPLIPGVGRSLALVTSRSQLTSLAIRDGAQRTRLETLSEAESINLLTTTTGAFRDRDTPEEVAELAKLCAYLPLALRIAAERAASHPGMPLQELIKDLRDKSEMWDALSTDDGSQASAVRSVFAWSYRALPHAAARLFCFLGLHPGSEFSQDTAAVLAGGSSREVRNALGILEGASLLESKGYQRYKFHDLLRIYAIDQASYEIPQDEQLSAVRRVCEWYLRSTYNCTLSLAHDTSLLFQLPESDVSGTQFTGRDSAAQWYVQEKANLVGATRAAFETQQFETAWRLGVVLERIYATYNHFQDWRSTSELALAAARELGRRADEAAAHESLGRLCRVKMELGEAAVHIEAAIAIYREIGDTLNLVKSLNGLAWAYLFGHRLEDARSALADGLAAVRAADDQYWTACILFGLGYACTQLLRFDEAQQHLTESLAIFRAMNDRFYESMVLWLVGNLAYARGDAGSALTDTREAVDIARDLDNGLWEATALLYLGKAQLAAGDPGGALESYQRSEVLCRLESDLSRGAWAIEGAGRAYAQLGRLADAAEFYRIAITIFRQVGDDWKVAKALARLADALPGNSEEAARCRQEAIGLLMAYPDPKSLALRGRLAEIS